MKTTDEFRDELYSKYGERLIIPSDAEYRGSKKPIKAICPKHGETWMTPNSLLNGCGCKKCGYLTIASKKRYKPSQWIEMAITRHGEKYDYSKVYEDYGTTNKVRIVCNECGKEFRQRPSAHLIGDGCPYCRPFPQKDTLESVQAKVQYKFPNITVTSESYYDNDSAIRVKCIKHGREWDTNLHTLMNQKYGCEECYQEARKEKIREEQAKEFKKLLEEEYAVRYDISHAVYKTCKDKVLLVCPKHGEFLLAPNKIVTRKDGCPYCKESKLEKAVSLILEGMGIFYCREKKFDWLVDKGKMSLDFFLPHLMVGIECQGEQHFKKGMSFFGDFNDKLRQDTLKFEQCKSNGIQIIYVADEKYIPLGKDIPIYSNGIETLSALKEKLATLYLW